MKYVQEHCAICQKDQPMPVVQEEEGHPGLIWVQCPGCHEIKPLEAAGARQAETAAGTAEGRPGRETEPRRVVRHYRSGERFSPGEWIYHPGWDDTGQVMEKRHSGGGHEIIVVSFQKMGTRCLINNFAR